MPSRRPDASTSDPMKLRQLARSGLSVQPSSLHPALRGIGHLVSGIGVADGTAETRARRSVSPGSHGLIPTPRSEQQQRRGRALRREEALQDEVEDDRERGRCRTPRPTMTNLRAAASQAAAAGREQAAKVERVQEEHDDDSDDDQSLTPSPSVEQLRAMAAQIREQEP